MEIVSIARPKSMRTARDWMNLMAQQAPEGCRGDNTIIAEDATSVTFERRLPDCPAARAGLGIYRLVTGKRSWFQLAVLTKGELDAASRSEWLSLLASAHIR